MKTYRTQEEVMDDVVGNILTVKDDVTFECDIDMPEVSIDARNITACYINAYNIDACNIHACNIDVHNINVCNIEALNIDANNIEANNIEACGITSNDIIANNIDAHNIDYYAVCFAYESLICNSIKGRRHNSKHFCLDSEIIIKEK